MVRVNIPSDSHHHDPQVTWGIGKKYGKYANKYLQSKYIIYASYKILQVIFTGMFEIYRQG